jgi:hypothetical protein
LGYHPRNAAENQLTSLVSAGELYEQLEVAGPRKPDEEMDKKSTTCYRPPRLMWWLRLLAVNLRADVLVDMLEHEGYTAKSEDISLWHKK